MQQAWNFSEVKSINFLALYIKMTVMTFDELIESLICSCYCITTFKKKLLRYVGTAMNSRIQNSKTK